MASRTKPRIAWQLSSLFVLALLVACSPSLNPPIDDFPPTPPTATEAPATATSALPSTTPTAAPPSATPIPSEMTETGNTIIEIGGSESVIFAAQNAANQGVDLWFNVPAEDYWTPTPEEIEALEEALPSFLEESAGERYPRIWQELPTYKRQYLGVVVEGQREILGVYFCASYYDYFEEWPDEIAAVNDGGDCFFELRYNLETDTFNDFSVHGEA